MELAQKIKLFHANGLFIWGYRKITYMLMVFFQGAKKDEIHINDLLSGGMEW